MKRPINHVTEEPCPCLPNFKCSPINCEYCEKIPTCGPGYELGKTTTEGIGRSEKCLTINFNLSPSFQSPLMERPVFRVRQASSPRKTVLISANNGLSKCIHMRLLNPRFFFWLVFYVTSSILM